MVRAFPALIVGVVLFGSLVASATPAPPQPGTENNGLTTNETATLWSHDTDQYVNESTYQDSFDQERGLMAELANGTDITFKRPPTTAATWTKHDFRDLEPGDQDASVHPPSAETTDGVLIADAHATIFSVHPSTRGHLTTDETPLYVAPEGQLRGLIDYRVRTPNQTGQRVLDHRVEATRLKQDGSVIARAHDTQTPVLDYHLENSQKTTLTLEADIHVKVNGPTGTKNRTTETLTVTDSIDVEVYDLTATSNYAQYPNGDHGIAVFQSRPWQGFTLNDEDKVRGVWRFYTARDTQWDTLIRESRDGETAVGSDALPVYVHAYPSRIGPRAEPVREGPEILTVWGQRHSSPNKTLGENVHVDVIDQDYQSSFGIAVRNDDLDPEALTVTGIVRGVNATLTEPETETTRQLRPSNLTVTVINSTPSQARLRIHLRDATTGEPITLSESELRNKSPRTPRTATFRSVASASKPM
ncbi:hypothetical protein ACFQH6_04665 [Halobacteriaceae archaeon GCM10025711]